MLTREQKDAIRAEEVFREEVRNEIASARGHRDRSAKLWGVLNSSLVIWFLTSIVVTTISWMISDTALNRERRETVRRLRWELYTSGLEFQAAVKHATNRFEYERAYHDKLQHPEPRVVDLRPFGLDRITFDMEHLGAPADRATAAAARGAAGAVWKVIESKLGGLTWDKWYAPLHDPTKNEINDRIIGIIQEDIIARFEANGPTSK